MKQDLGTLRARRAALRVAQAARQRGLTLVELMIALVLAMFVVLALVMLLSNVSRNNNELTKTSRLIENGRFAVQLISGELEHAGYLGGYIPKFDNLTLAVAPTDVPTAVPNPCTTFGTAWDAAFLNGIIGVPVAAYDLGSTVPSPTAMPVCPGSTSIVASPKANTDVLVVRYAERESCTPGTANCPLANTAYLQVPNCTTTASAGYSGLPYLIASDATAGSVTTFTLTERNCTTRAELRKLVSNLFYVRSYASTVGDGIPTLMRSQFTGTSQQAADALIENIEGFRVEFGLDTLSDSGAAVNFAQAVTWADPANLNSATNRGDGLPDGDYVRCTSAAPCTAAQLMNAVSVKIHVLVRADSPSPGYVDSKVYCLGTSCTPTVTTCPASSTNAQPALGPFCDGYKRHLFTQTVRLTNVSMRRETP